MLEFTFGIMAKKQRIFNRQRRKTEFIKVCHLLHNSAQVSFCRILYECLEESDGTLEGASRALP